MTEEENKILTGIIHKEIIILMQKVTMLEAKPRLQYMRSMCDLGGFAILKKLHFQKQNFFYNSLTTDGQYLYLYISTSNGGMFKIGTG